MRGHENTFVPDKSQCEQIINLFHPYDPVAYRLEPLFHSNYKLVRPARVFSYSESNRDYEKVPFELHKSYLKKMRKEAKRVSLIGRISLDFPGILERKTEERRSRSPTKSG